MAKKAVETIQTIKKILVISGAVIKLGAAIVSEHPGVIATAIGNLRNAVAA